VGAPCIIYIGKRERIGEEEDRNKEVKGGAYDFDDRCGLYSLAYSA
jgi:hypothetical protein